MKGGEAETIFAQASGRGRAGVAVLRLSGPAAFAAVARLSGGAALPEARRATLRSLTDPQSGSLLDRALVLLFAAPASFTGEDVAELHVHGGRAVVEGVLGALGAQSGLRPAEPGEFTRRAFENGRMDLTAAEGLNDLVAAQTAAQRTLALRQMAGGLGALYERWRADLIESRALIEAEIEFSEEDLPTGLAERVRPRLGALCAEIAAHLDDGRAGERLREGVTAVLLGRPNAGKSRLLNALAGRDAAIVSEIAGTTRDVIEVAMDVGGYPVTLVDTAGIREAGDAIEQEGVRRALARAADADLRLVLTDAADWPAPSPGISDLLDERTILVAAKADLRDDLAAGRLGGAVPAFAVSAATGAGLETLLAALEARVAELCDVGESPAITRARHRAALTDCIEALARFEAQIGADPVLAAEDLRLAARALGRITGRVDVEDVLDVIFTAFCIGK